MKTVIATIATLTALALIWAAAHRRPAAPPRPPSRPQGIEMALSVESGTHGAPQAVPVACLLVSNRTDTDFVVSGPDFAHIAAQFNLVVKRKNGVPVPRTRYGAWLARQCSKPLGPGTNSLRSIVAPKGSRTTLRFQLDRLFDLSMPGEYTAEGQFRAMPEMGPDIVVRIPPTAFSVASEGTVSASVAQAAPWAKSAFALTVPDYIETRANYYGPVATVTIANPSTRPVRISAPTGAAFVRRFPFALSRRGKPMPYTALGAAIYRGQGAAGFVEQQPRSITIPPRHRMSVEFDLTRLFDVSDPGGYQIRCSYAPGTAQESPLPNAEFYVTDVFID